MSQEVVHSICLAGLAPMTDEAPVTRAQGPCRRGSRHFKHIYSMGAGTAGVSTAIVMSAALVEQGNLKRCPRR